MATKKKRKKSKASRKRNPGKKRRGLKRRRKGRASNPKKRRGRKARRRNPNMPILAGIVGGAIIEAVSAPAAKFVGDKVHMGKSPMMHAGAKVVTRVALAGLIGKAAEHMGYDNVAAGVGGGLGAGLMHEAAMHFSKGKGGLAKSMRDMGMGHGSHIPLPGGGHIHVHAPENGPAQITATDDEGNATQLMGVKPMPFTMEDEGGQRESGMALADVPGKGTMYQDSSGGLKMLMGISLPTLGEVVRMGEVVKLGANNLPVLGEVVKLGDEELPQLGDMNEDEPDEGRHGYNRRR